jgi:hypothetical protein
MTIVDNNPQGHATHHAMVGREEEDKVVVVVVVEEMATPITTAITTMA